ncbi:uncharacterized protein DEA37_0012885 [Paragonimus westermani]|uniref:Snake toxin/toxin-like domain-containing protein n=1 Tax=Paragonimus westermani TaxID=34504 RepID=A0A5J4N8M7_9TREM|nr:uncharacterized protein DEA37_0012885 [Paragonimus westermani]
MRGGFVYAMFVMVFVLESANRTTALDCYQDEYNPVNGHTVKTTRGNCVFCVLEEWTPAPNMRSEYHTCSVHCWPYILSNSRRICCRTNLCNNDGLSGKFAF